MSTKAKRRKWCVRCRHASEKLHRGFCDKCLLNLAAKAGQKIEAVLNAEEFIAYHYVFNAGVTMVRTWEGRTQ